MWHMCVCPYMAAAIMQQHAEKYKVSSSRPDMSEARHLCSRVSASCKSSPVHDILLPKAVCARL